MWKHRNEIQSVGYWLLSLRLPCCIIACSHFICTRWGQSLVSIVSSQWELFNWHSTEQRIMNCVARLSRFGVSFIIHSTWLAHVRNKPLTSGFPSTFGRDVKQCWSSRLVPETWSIPHNYDSSDDLQRLKNQGTVTEAVSLMNSISKSSLSSRLPLLSHFMNWSFYTFFVTPESIALHSTLHHIDKDIHARCKQFDQPWEHQLVEYQ